MNKKFLAAGMAAAMAATMLPSMAFADEQPTVTLLVPEYNAGKSLKNEGSDEVIKRVQEYTGINFEIKWGDNGAYDQVLGTTLMDFDNMPMILTCGGAMNGTIVSAAEEGAFWDLSEYLDDSEKFPNLSQVSRETLKGLTVGGEVIGIPRVRELGRYGFSYRQDWADKLGLGTPETIQDVYDMLYAFTYNDPDGNGVDGDTYGVSSAGLIGTEAPYTNYLPEFYQDAYPSFYKNDEGVWVDGFTEDSMKAALERLKSAYEAGYIDKESLTNATSDCRTKFYEDKFGVFTYWAGTWATNLKINLEANGLDSELVAIPPIEELGAYTERVAPAWCITEACSNPEGVYKYFIESMLDGGDMQFLWTYGVEGVHWSTAAEEVCGVKYEEGQFHMLENGEKEGTAYTKNHIDPMLAVAPLENDPKAEAVAEEAKVSAETFQEHSKMAQLVVSTDEMAEYNGDLTTLKNEVIAKVVTQGMSVEDGMAYFDQQGGNDWSQKIVDSLNN